MKRHMQKWIGVALICALSLAGCIDAAQSSEVPAATEATEPTESTQSPPPTEASEPDPVDTMPEYFMDQRIPEEVRELVLENRKESFQIFDPSLQPQLDSYVSEDLTLEEDQRIAAVIASCLEQGQRPVEITPEQAGEDVQLLFDYLKYYYAGYAYFGGDEALHPLRDKLLEELAEREGPIPIQELDAVLVDCLLPIFRDCHFSIGETMFMDTYANRYFSVCEEYRFHRGEDGSYTVKLDGTEYVLQSVDGSDAFDLMPYLDAEGRPCWVLGRYHAEPGDSVRQIALMETGSGSVREETAVLVQADTAYAAELGDGVYRVGEREGIPVVENRRLWVDTGELGELEAFSATGADLYGEPVVIVDLRHNGGGSDTYAALWLQNFLGLEQRPYYNLMMVLKENRTLLTAASWMLEGEGMTEEELATLEPVNQVDTGPAQPPEPFPNSGLLFVLVDQEVASSGEGFLAMLKQTENTVVVGTNTSGCKTFGECNRIYLPNSRIPIYCGCKLFLMPNLAEVEGTGYLPDLWAPPGQSLDRILKFIDNYGLRAQ